MKELIQIDDLLRICGYSYSLEEPTINNGYNCDHPDCEEIEFVKNNQIVDVYEETVEYLKRITSGKKKRLKKKLIKNIMSLLDKDEFSFGKKLNIKQIGKCYTFSCPVACHAYLEDMKELDSDLYEEYKDEGDEGDEDNGYLDTSDWMVYDGDES